MTEEILGDGVDFLRQTLVACRQGFENRECIGTRYRFKSGLLTSIASLLGFLGHKLISRSSSDTRAAQREHSVRHLPAPRCRPRLRKQRFRRAGEIRVAALHRLRTGDKGAQLRAGEQERRHLERLVQPVADTRRAFHRQAARPERRRDRWCAR